MRRGSSVLRFVAAGLLTLLVAAPVAASRVSDDHIDVLHMSPPRPSPQHVERTTAETLWIFDADFEDLSGDNAGWTTYDRSGTPAWVNYWHKDTIRINGFTHLGDSTWWCGTYSNCWRQPRGYGNDWTCDLVRSFPEVASLSEPGDQLLLSYDQRFALEMNYDYGFTDVSADGGATWTTIATMDNPGFGGPGISVDWDSTYPGCSGHMELDLSAYAGQAIDIRFRVESDQAYSSEDVYDTPNHPVLDGAWQLDNIRLWAVAAGTTTIFFDDCESPGDNGWVHDDVPASGQIGLVFGRGVLGVDFETGHFSCDQGTGWMYAAVDPLTGGMVDGQYSWLMSPPIDIEGVTDIVGQWHMWVDLPEASHDIYNLYLAAVDLEECISMKTRFVDEHPGWWSGGPHWVTVTDNWTPFAGRNWLGILWAVLNDEPPEPGAEHGTGIFLNRQRVGVPIGGAGDSWEYGSSCYSRFHDWFKDDLAAALTDSAWVYVVDYDDVVSVALLASADGGATWQSYSCFPDGHTGWLVPPPTGQIAEGAEVLYYFEAVDDLGQASTFPESAPDDCFEFSILPITGSVTSPGILLVDKHCAPVPGEDRSWKHTSLDYYIEALDVLGHDYDVYQVPWPGRSCGGTVGPDTTGMKYYDTQIWITGNLHEETISPVDQLHLVSWLSEASEVKDRNLFVAGDNVGKELIGDGADTLGFYTDWLAAEYLSDSVGEVTVDSLPVLQDADGSFDFMTFDDRRCVLRGGCPELGYFDVVQPYPGAAGTECVAEYVRTDMTVLPAGVAHTDTIYGYQTVTLGFGIESIVDVPLPSGHYTSGASDRVDLMSNVMDYFGKPPAGPGTGIPGDGQPVDSLEHAYPNPFNPSTTIGFSIATRGRVTARVYDLAGRKLRTLVDEVLEPGPHRTSWDGRTDAGRGAPSGVYFIKVEAPGFHATRKLVLLK